MKALETIGLAILGIIVGSGINMGLVYTGGFIFPDLSEINIPDPETGLVDATNAPLKYFLFPFLAHAIGTLAGAAISSKLAKISNGFASSMIVGAFFLAGGFAVQLMIIAPDWFNYLDLIVCYIPMAWLGWKIGRKNI